MCEDAATFKQNSGTSFVNGGGARNAEDKVLQHNGGGTVAVKNFFATNVGKVYRSCGNCGEQFARSSSFEGIRVEGGDVVAGVNGNLDGECAFIHFFSSFLSCRFSITRQTIALQKAEEIFMEIWGKC